MTQAQQPEAMRIAMHLRSRAQISSTPGNLDTLSASAANELERQHTRIQELEAALATIQPEVQGMDMAFTKLTTAYKELSDANIPDPLPTCQCGRPSNQLWMGHGFCSEAHCEEFRAAHKTVASPSMHITEMHGTKLPDGRILGAWKREYTIPAQGMDAPRYRLIDRGELIEAGDQFLRDDFTWQIDPKGIFVGVPHGAALRPARRALAAQSKQGGA